jgi:hypothetical protein
MAGYPGKLVSVVLIPTMSNIIHVEGARDTMTTVVPHLGAEIRVAPHPLATRAGVR